MSKIIRAKKDGRVAQAVEHLSSRCKAKFKPQYWKKKRRINPSGRQL
jgi:hypothetical protein